MSDSRYDRRYSESQRVTRIGQTITVEGVIDVRDHYLAVWDATKDLDGDKRLAHQVVEARLRRRLKEKLAEAVAQALRDFPHFADDEIKAKVEEARLALPDYLPSLLRHGYFNSRNRQDWRGLTSERTDP